MVTYPWQRIPGSISKQVRITLVKTKHENNRTLSKNIWLFEQNKYFIPRNLETFEETINELWYTPTVNVSNAQNRQGNQIGM